MSLFCLSPFHAWQHFPLVLFADLMEPQLSHGGECFGTKLFSTVLTDAWFSVL